MCLCSSEFVVGIGVIVSVIGVIVVMRKVTVVISVMRKVTVVIIFISVTLYYIITS
jgi:multisubunit Na+/H+ antiporter MnhE subunit